MSTKVPEPLLQVLPIQVVLGSEVAEDGSRLCQRHSINFNQRDLTKKQAPVCGMKERVSYSSSTISVVAVHGQDGPTNSPECFLLKMMNDKPQ